MKTKKKATGGKRSLRGANDLRDDEKRMKILEQALVSGHTYKMAAEFASIHIATIFRWIKEGEAAPEGTRAREISDRLKKASADAVHRNLMVIQQAARKNWQAAAWFLERRCPDDYARPIRAEITGRDGTPVRVETGPDLTKMPTDDLRQIRDILKRAGQG